MLQFLLFHPVMERAIIQLVYRAGRSRGSEPHLAQGWEIFVFIRADRAAPLAVLLSLLSLRNTETPNNREEKSLNIQTFKFSSHGEVLVLAALWGIPHTHSLWTWQLSPQLVMSRLLGAETKQGPHAAFPAASQSKTHVNNPSSETDGKTKLHIPTSAVKKGKMGDFPKLNTLGGNQKNKTIYGSSVIKNQTTHKKHY